MNKFCSLNGIKHETTNPYRPQQNGIAERTIAILMEMTRSMLHGARMNVQYWGEAFMYAVYIRTITPTSGLEGKIPYTEMSDSNCKPDVSHLRIFGSLGWAHVPKEVRHGKLEPRAIHVRMLGWWADETKGYKLEDLENGKLIASRDVQFHEDSTPSELAHVKLSGSNPEEIDNLIDTAIYPDSDEPRIVSISSDSEHEIANSLLEPDSPRESYVEESSVGDLQYPTPSRSTSPTQVTPTEVTPPIEISPVARKSNKWENLPRRAPSNRERHMPGRFQDYEPSDSAFHSAFVTINGPSMEEALKTTCADDWKNAIDSEYRQLVNKRVINEIDNLPEGKRAIGSKVVLKEKLDENGNHSKFKARIVAQGFSQIPGIDYDETFSSVAKFNTLRIFLTLAAIHDLEIHQIDVIGAYLEGNVDEEIYMRAPEGIGKKKYWRLLKAIYGLKQAGRNWKQRLHDTLIRLGFKQTCADDCLYILRNCGKITLIVLVYVDDMAIAGRNLLKIISFKKDLDKEFDITDLGDIQYILGLKVRRDRSKRIIYLSQSSYIESILNRFQMSSCTPVSTPMTTNHNLTSVSLPENHDEKEEYAQYAKGINYLSLVGSLLYATQTRPDIQFSVNLTAQFSANPSIAHLAACKRILRYLKGTKEYSLRLGGYIGDEIKLVGWSDANWAGDVRDRKSISGWSFDINGSTVTWSSKKQSVVATSTVEAEYIASSNATREAIWLRTLLSELDFPQVTATIIHSDSAGSIALSNNPVSHSRAKHIDIRYHFIRDQIDRGNIKLEYVSTKDMIADILTKALPRDAFEKCREKLGVINI